MKKIIPTIVFLFFVTISYSNTFYAIIAANTEIPDIGKSCELDQIAMTIELNAIATAIGYDFKNINITKGNFNFENLEKTIRDFKCDTTDIIIFYYSGHGFNDEKNNSKWPIMHLETGSYPIEKVHEQLKQKGARLVITLGDCCNNVVNMKMADNKGFVQIDINPQNVKTGLYKNLFVGIKGDIIATGSTKGQFSHSTNNTGGYFTNKLILALKNAINYSKNISWNYLLEDTKNRVENVNFEQKQSPQFEVHIGNDLMSNQIISFAEINSFINRMLIIPVAKSDKARLIEQFKNYCSTDARVDIYVNSTLTEMMTIGDFIDRLELHQKKISTINFIESKSDYDTIQKRYTKITVQEIW